MLWVLKTLNEMFFWVATIYMTILPSKNLLNWPYGSDNIISVCFVAKYPRTSNIATHWQFGYKSAYPNKESSWRQCGIIWSGQKGLKNGAWINGYLSFIRRKKKQLCLFKETKRPPFLLIGGLARFFGWFVTHIYKKSCNCQPWITTGYNIFRLLDRNE